VAVPFDFRRSITEAAERLDVVVNAHFGDASEAERAGRVIVVGHSMGGLVARVWMGLLGRWPWCRALITLGTPHRGAPAVGVLPAAATAAAQGHGRGNEGEECGGEL